MTISNDLLEDYRRRAEEGLSFDCKQMTKVLDALEALGPDEDSEPDLAEMFGDHPMADIFRELEESSKLVLNVTGVTTPRSKVMLVAAHVIHDLREAASDGDHVEVHQAKDGSWGVSHHQVWVEGAYESEAVARRAPFVDCDDLSALWKRVCPEPITSADLDAIDAGRG